MTLQPLSYDTPRGPEPTAWLHLVAQICGTVPLVFGSFVFLMFLATRESIFVILGIWTVLVGVAAAFVGVVCAAIYLYQAARAAPGARELARRAARRDIAVIVINFPVAIAMALVGTMLLPGW